MYATIVRLSISVFMGGVVAFACAAPVTVGATWRIDPRTGLYRPGKARSCFLEDDEVLMAQTDDDRRVRAEERGYISAFAIRHEPRQDQLNGGRVWPRGGGRSATAAGVRHRRRQTCSALEARGRHPEGSQQADPQSALCSSPEGGIEDIPTLLAYLHRASFSEVKPSFLTFTPT